MRECCIYRCGCIVQKIAIFFFKNTLSESIQIIRSKYGQCMKIESIRRSLCATMNRFKMRTKLTDLFESIQTASCDI